MPGRKETISITEARNTVVDTSQSYGLHPTWRVPFAYKDEAGSGSTRHDNALSQLEDSVRVDLVNRLVDTILESDCDANQKRSLIKTVEKISRASKRANVPPVPVRVERPLSPLEALEHRL